MVKLVAPALLLALAACAASSPSAQNAASAEVPRALQGRVVGEPISCINNRDIRDTDAITDRVMLFHMRNGRTYRNDLPLSCPRLSRSGTAFVHRTITSQLCDVDVIQVFDPVSGFQYGGCQLGKFTPYEMPEGASRG